MTAAEMMPSPVDSAPDAIMVVDGSGSIVYLNDQVSALLGYEASELVGQPVERVLPERFRDRHVRHRQDFTAQARFRKMGGGYDVSALRKDGAEFLADVRLSPIVGRAEPFVVVSIRDASERKRAEAERRESHERFLELGSQSRDVIWIVGLNPVRVMYVSPAVERVWGLVPAQLYQNHRAWEPLVHPEDRQRVFLAWEEACAPSATRGFEAEYRVVHPDGSIHWLSDVLTPVRNAAGHVVRLCGVSRDITEQKRLERALLEAADRERRAIGHDLHDGLGQELTAIALLAAAMASSAKKARRNAEEMQRLESLARRAIATCRSIARGLCPLGYADGSLVEALRDMASEQSGTFGADVRFEAITDAPLRLLPEACIHLYRIAQEAVTNARRHAHSNLIKVMLEVRPNTVRLEVLDNGKGLAPSAAESNGMGLRSMEFRAGIIGGRLSIGPGQHGGTLVKCECAQTTQWPVVKATARSAGRR